MIEIKYFGAVAEKTKCEFEKIVSSEISLQE
jgi:molybdopterin synthase sulfur carrier subunit